MPADQTLKVTKPAQLAVRQATRQLQVLFTGRITQSTVLVAAFAVALRHQEEFLGEVLDNSPLEDSRP